MRGKRVVSGLSAVPVWSLRRDERERERERVCVCRRVCVCCVLCAVRCVLSVCAVCGVWFGGLVVVSALQTCMMHNQANRQRLSVLLTGSTAVQSVTWCGMACCGGQVHCGGGLGDGAGGTASQYRLYPVSCLWRSTRVSKAPPDPGS